VRALSCRTSHLANLSQNPRGKIFSNKTYLFLLQFTLLKLSIARQNCRVGKNIDRDADDLEHTFSLLLSVHNALFRQASPLLLNYNEISNQDLLGHDSELIRLAIQLRSSIMWFRDMGFPKSVRSGLFYHKRIGNKLRSALRGM